MSSEVNTNEKSSSGLRARCLSFVEVLGQSIANIAPSGGPALGIQLVFLTAGNGTWLAYIFATIAVVLVGYNIKQFAKRSASPGALYTYVADGLGAGSGIISGWGLVLAYLLTGCAVLAAFAHYANITLSYFGLQVAPIILCIIGGFVVWLFTFKDIQLSAKTMLVVEGLSIFLISIVGVAVLIHKGGHLDVNQFTLKNVSFDSIRIGLVLAFFSFVGFESATTLGEEAKKPLKNIPKAVISSSIFVGVFFVIFAYIEILGFAGLKTKFADIAAPLPFLAKLSGIGYMGFFVSVGIMISFWSCAIACIVAASRILLTMGQQKILHSSLGQVHKENDTPYVAIAILSVITILIPVILIYYKSSLLDIFGWLGTIATLGFLLSYAMIVVAVPLFLHKRGELKISNVVMAIISFIILLIPIVGSVYPLPPYPYSMFPFIFVGWLLLSASWYALLSVKKQDVVKQMKQEIQQNNQRYDEAAKAVNE